MLDQAQAGSNSRMQGSEMRNASQKLVANCRPQVSEKQRDDFK